MVGLVLGVGSGGNSSRRVSCVLNDGGLKRVKPMDSSDFWYLGFDLQRDSVEENKQNQ